MTFASPATMFSGPGMACDETADSVRLDDAGHEDAVGPDIEVTDRPLDRLGEHVTRRTGEVGVGAGIQHEGARRGRGPGSREALGGLLDGEQSVLPGVLEVASHRPDIHCPGNGATDCLRGVAVSRFEVGGHRHLHCGHDPSDVFEHGVAIQ